MVLMAVALGFFVLGDPYISRTHRRTMLQISILVLTLIAVDFFDMLLSTQFVNLQLRMLNSIYGYSVRPVILVLFCTVVCPEREFLLSWIVVGLNAVFYLSNLYTHHIFYFSEDNHFGSTPWNYACFIVSIVFLLYLLYLTAEKYRKTRNWRDLMPLLNAFLVIAGVILDYNVGSSRQTVSFLTIGIVLSSDFFYIWLHLQYVQAHEQEIVQVQRTQIMLSQIQPHFLSNSLEVIRRLIRKDPKNAENAIIKLERYLRGNMESLTQEGLIPFSKELEHTKMYLELEQYRFPDELHIEYDLKCTEFELPPLTLQPMAENAVRHGIRRKKSGEGTVRIGTREFSDRCEVFVRDDGPGFDPEATMSDGRAHVGISNVRERLDHEGMKLKISSRLQEGTEVRIIIPKGRKL